MNGLRDQIFMMPSLRHESSPTVVEVVRLAQVSFGGVSRGPLQIQLPQPLEFLGRASNKSRINFNRSILEPLGLNELYLALRTWSGTLRSCLTPQRFCDTGLL